MLDNPKVGIVFVIPGVSETLRVNGSVELIRAPEILERLSAGNKPTILATQVTVEEGLANARIDTYPAVRTIEK